LQDDPLVERRMLSEGAAWIVADILRNIPPPDGAVNVQQIAWKTGTSYGFRDAWSVGVGDRYTVGVWTGRPDGTPLPGQFGAYAAGPILFDVFRALPKTDKSFVANHSRPANVERVDICWPLGVSATETLPENCHVRRQAWIVDGHIPPTLPNLQQSTWSAGIKSYWVNPLTGLRLSAECSAPQRVERQYAQWPVELHPWLSNALLDKMRLPELDGSCPASITLQAERELAIRSLDTTTRLYLPQTSVNQGVSIDLQADGGQGGYFWLINGELVGEDSAHQGLRHTFTQPGDYELTVLDTAGAVDKVSIRVVHSP
jgi:penicillin-binding protein 1C